MGTLSSSPPAFHPYLVSSHEQQPGSITLRGSKYIFPSHLTSPNRWPHPGKLNVNYVHKSTSFEPQRSQQQSMSLEKVKEEMNDDKGIFPPVLNFMEMASWPCLEMSIIDSLLMESYVDRIPRDGAQLFTLLFQKWAFFPILPALCSDICLLPWCSSALWPSRRHGCSCASCMTVLQSLSMYSLSCGWPRGSQTYHVQPLTYIPP